MEPEQQAPERQHLVDLLVSIILESFTLRVFILYTRAECKCECVFVFESKFMRILEPAELIYCPCECKLRFSVKVRWWSNDTKSTDNLKLKVSPWCHEPVAGEIRHHRLVGVALGWTRIPLHRGKSRHIAETSAGGLKTRRARSAVVWSPTRREAVELSTSAPHTDDPRSPTSRFSEAYFSMPLLRVSTLDRSGPVSARRRAQRIWEEAGDNEEILRWLNFSVHSARPVAVTKGLAHEQVSSSVWFCFHPDLCCLDKCIQMHLGAQRRRSGHVSAAAT